MANVITLEGGDVVISASLDGGDIYPSGGGGGGNLQAKSVSYTPTEVSVSDHLTPSAGYDGFSYVDVSIDGISPTYIGSAIPLRNSSDLSASGATVTAPYGYYGAAATKTIQDASTPTIDSRSVDSSGYVTVDIEIDNGGYIATGTYEATDSVPLPTQGAQTIYPSTSDQTIASSKYLTGAQTIKGVTYSGLDASNIKKDVVVKIGDSADDDRILSVTGTYEGGGANLESKSVSYTPTETEITALVTPSTGYDGLSQVDVTIGAISSSYVGSAIPRKSSSDLTASGATVTAPSGYYSASASKTISNASQALTDAYVLNSGDLEVELNTSSGGYVANGNQYLQFEDFATPVPTTTYYATSSDQVIMSQNSMTFGTQTIKGVTYSGLDAGNIKKDVVVKIGDSADDDRILSVTGTYEGGGGSFDLLDYTSPSGAYTSNGTTAKIGAFYGRTGITSLTLPLCTTCQENAFAYMTNLETVSMASLTTGAKNMFQYDAKLETISLPLMTNIPENFLSQCDAYKNVVLPSVTTLGASAFDYGKSKNHGYLVLGKQGATSSLSALQNTGWNLMRNSIFSVVDCAMPLNHNGNPSGSVTTLILRSTTMSTLSNVGYRLGGVTDIYVPSALLSSYQSASNWSTLYSAGTITLTAIEGSYYETHYADGTAIS